MSGLSTRIGSAIIAFMCAYIFVVAVVLLILTGCKPTNMVSPTTGNSNRAGSVVYLPPIEWRIVSQEQLEREWKIAHSEEPPRGVTGMAITVNGRHIIYTTPPMRSDDASTRVLGHEVMHVAFGNYHGYRSL